MLQMTSSGHSVRPRFALSQVKGGSRSLICTASLFAASPAVGVAMKSRRFTAAIKAVVMATEVHLGRGGVSNIYGVNVEELGPTQPGGSPTAIDDRSEW